MGEEVMTSSVPGVAMVQSDQKVILCTVEERGKSHFTKGCEREAPSSKEFQHEFYFVYPLVKLFVTSIIHRKRDHFSPACQIK